VGIIFFLGLAVRAFAADVPQVFFDRSGNRITVTKPYRRIISLYGAHTENLFALGLDREIIGVSIHERFPPAALEKPVFSYHDDAEKIIAARPDLVLVRPMIMRGYPGLIAKLENAGILVVSLQASMVGDMFAYWEKLGILTGKEKEALKMISEFQCGVEKIRQMAKQVLPSERKRVYFESMHARMKTFSPVSISIFALETAGGINVASDARAVHGTNIAAYGKERIMAHADKIDVYLAQKGPMNQVTQDVIRNEPGFAAIKAVREGRIYIVEEDIVSRPTLRLLEGIRTIFRILYPEIWAQNMQEFKTDYKK